MKTIYLMRHAKSSKDIFGITDIERPLLLEGIENTKQTTEHLKKINVIIRNIVSSPAKRAYETASVVAQGFGVKKDDILTYDELYKPDIPAFEDCLFSLPDDWDHVLLVSHNPGITEFAESLYRIGESMPTGSILALSFEMDKWINLYASIPEMKFYLK